MLIRQVTLAIVLLGSAPATATRWHQYGQDRTNTTYWVDLDSGKRSGDRVVLWERREHAADRTIRQRETVNRIEVDCRERRFRFLETVLYDAKGAVIDTQTAGEGFEPDWSTAPPDSIGETLVAGACSRERTPLGSSR